MDLPTIAYWATLKGISLVGTGDWTHPLWLNELKSQLEEVKEGIYKLKFPISNFQFPNNFQIPNSPTSRALRGAGNFQIPNSKFQDPNSGVRFLLATEISSIYSQGGRQRRIHNLVLAPSFAVVEKINEALRAVGCNLDSDGRPIIGLSSRQLCELVFSISDCLTGTMSSIVP